MLLTLAAPTPEVRPEDACLPAAAHDLSKTRELTESETQEVLGFLSVRPAHTVVMASFICDNGIASELNRGRFFGFRNSDGLLEGVALIGHTTLVEARSDEALKALATAAKTSEHPIHLIMSSGDSAANFWNCLHSGTRLPRLTCTEALFEISFPFAVPQSEWQVNNAGPEHLLDVARAQAEVAFQESGTDPMVRDREGFLGRVRRRIEQNRVFVVYEGETLVFKADIIAETKDTAYLEGVWVNPAYRGRHIGSKCLSSLSMDLLGRVDNICLLSNVKFAGAHKSFERAGYKNTAECTTLFV